MLEVVVVVVVVCKDAVQWPFKL